MFNRERNKGPIPTGTRALMSHSTTLGQHRVGTQGLYFGFCPSCRSLIVRDENCTETQSTPSSSERTQGKRHPLIWQDSRAASARPWGCPCQQDCPHPEQTDTPPYPAQAPPPCPGQQILTTYIHVAGIDVAILCVRVLQHHAAVIV